MTRLLSISNFGLVSISSLGLVLALGACGSDKTTGTPGTAGAGHVAGGPGSSAGAPGIPGAGAPGAGAGAGNVPSAGTGSAWRAAVTRPGRAPRRAQSEWPGAALAWPAPRVRRRCAGSCGGCGHCGGRRRSATVAEPELVTSGKDDYWKVGTLTKGGTDRHA